MGLPICAIDGPERKRRRLDDPQGVSDTDDVPFKDDVASSSATQNPRLALWSRHDISSDSETSEEDDDRPFADSLQSFARALPPLNDPSGDNPMIPASVLQPWRMWDNSEEEGTQVRPARRRTLLTLPLRRRNAFRVSSTSRTELDSEIDNNRRTRSPPPQVSEAHLMSELAEFVPGGTLSAELTDLYRQGMVSAQEAAYLSRSGSEDNHLTHVSDSVATTPLRASTPLELASQSPEMSSSSRLARLEADFERLETERRMRDFEGVDYSADSHYGPVSNVGSGSFLDHPPDAHLGDLTSPRITISDQPVIPLISQHPDTVVQHLGDEEDPLSQPSRPPSVHFEFPEPPGVTEFHSGASIDTDSNRSLPSDSPSGHVSFGSVSFAADTADSHSSSDPGESPESPQVLPIEDTLVIPFTRSPSPYEYPVSPASSIDFERRDYNRRRSRSLECLEEGGRRGRSRGARGAREGRAAYASDPEPDVATFSQSGEEARALRRSNSLPFSSRRQSVGSQSEPESSMRRSRSQSTGSDRRVRFRLAVRFQ